LYLRGLNKRKPRENHSDSVYGNAWRKLKKNRPAMFGLFVILFAALIAILGGNIRPDASKNSNNVVPPIDRIAPGSVVNHLLVHKNDETVEAGFFGKLFMWGSDLSDKYYPYFDYNIVGSEIVVENYSKLAHLDSYTPDYNNFQVADVLYSLNYLRENNIIDNGDGTQTIYLLDSTKITRSIEEMVEEVQENKLVSKTYYLGTDTQGRDMLSRLMAGTFVSLSVGFIAVIISLFLGVILGMLAGYYRGWVDKVVMYVVSVVWSIPGLLFLISFMMVMGKGFTTLFIGIGLIMWVDLARLVRGQVMSLREKEYIEAGKSLGFKDGRILFRHVFPNIIGPVIVQCANNFAVAILLEAGLSYLGIGVKIPMSSWGIIITNHKDYLGDPVYGFTAVLPGVFILLLVFAFMMLGNGLRDAFDAKSVDATSNV
jgi:peptide/nickel transport system permease protein